jgi:hypothetical protein
MRAILAIAFALTSLAAGTAAAQGTPPAQAPATTDFGTARVENGVIYMPAARIAVAVPAGAKVSQVTGNGFGYRRSGQYDDYVSFYEGQGTCADWEARWRNKKFGDSNLSAKIKRTYPARPASYDPRWHGVLVTDGGTVAKACVTDPSGRWVELEVSGAGNYAKYTGQDMPAMTHDIGKRMFGSAAPPPPPRPSMWAAAAKSYYKAKFECDTYSQSTDSRVRFLGQLQCDVSRTQETWIQGCENDNVVYCTTAAKSWSKNKEYHAAGAFFERACENGDKPSCKEALKNYDRACKENNGNACSAAETLRAKTQK